MSQIFCLDSGVFINGWRKHYHNNVFPSLWTHLENILRSRRAFVTNQIYQEIMRIDDDLNDWLKERKDCVTPDSDELQMQVKEIVNSYPRLVSVGSGRSSADPYLIAAAFLAKGVVVSDESPSNNINNPKIPDVCKDLDIECIKPVVFYHQTGLVL